MAQAQLNKTRGCKWFDCHIFDMEGPSERHAWVYAKNAKEAAVYLWKESGSLVNIVEVTIADSDYSFSPCDYQKIYAYTEWKKRARI